MKLRHSIQVVVILTSLLLIISNVSAQVLSNVVSNHKIIKDIERHGHGVGDQVLRAVAARLRATLRASDLAARVGGDEFLVLLPDIDAEAALRLAERVVEVMSQPYGDDLPPVTASVGIATFPDDGAHDVQSLMIRADEALYVSKRAGKRRASIRA